MNLQPITPYQLQKNMEAMQKQYDDLVQRTRELLNIIQSLEKKVEDLNNATNME